MWGNIGWIKYWQIWQMVVIDKYALPTLYPSNILPRTLICKSELFVICVNNSSMMVAHSTYLTCPHDSLRIMSLDYKRYIKLLQSFD